MTPEVKKRIEQIHQGIAPDGYTKTRSGITPTTWTPACLGNIYTERREPGNESLPLLTVSIHSGVSDGELDEDELPKKVKRIEDKSQYKRAATGDLVFNMMRAWQGAIGTVRTEGMVSPAYIVAKPNGKVYPPFMDYYMKAPRMVGMINRQSYGVTDFRKRLYWDSFAPIPCVLPPVREQRKIAEILSTQDKAIELQARKIDELKRFKKGCLERMFPRKGQKVPEKRFPGFTDDWEQRKAIDIADYSKGNGYSKGDLTDAGTPIILYGRLYTKYQFAISEVDTFAVPRNGAVYSQGNEVIVPASGETAEDIARASAVEKSGVLLGGDLNILRPFDFINPLFLALAISNGEPQKELAKKAQGKSVVHIHNTDIQEVTIAYPSRTEQDRIVSVFRQLDNLITLHQRKLEEMKKQKKALMQLLLTGIVRV